MQIYCEYVIAVFGTALFKLNFFKFLKLLKTFLIFEKKIFFNFEVQIFTFKF